MAERDGAFEFSTRYDWNAWLDGDTWRLRAGVDFQVSPAVFRSQAHKAASRRDGTVLTEIDGDEFVLRFIPPIAGQGGQPGV